MSLLRDFLTNESGSAAIEYAILAAGIALAIITGVSALGEVLKSKFEAVNTAFH